MRARLAAAARSVCVALESGDLVGSGVFVGPAEVLTCAHVVSDPDGPVTGRWNERELFLRVAEWLPDLDLALLRCDGEVADLYAALLEDGTVGVTWRKAAFERLRKLRPCTPDPFPPAPDQAWERMAHVARAKDPEQAWAALRDPRVPALPRVFACLLLQDWSPEDGRAALDELANDPTLGGFHRVFWGQDQARPAADPTLDSGHRRRCDMMARWIRSR